VIWQGFSQFVLKLRSAAWYFVYRGFRARYGIAPSFRFNGTGIHLFGDGQIHLGEHSYIGEHSSIQAAAGLFVNIGSHCAISHNVRIYTTTAMADADLRRGPPPTQGGSVTIGDGVWIGMNVYIGPGVTIGSDAVIGANAVVTRDIPGGEIWGGVPAQRIRAKVNAEGDRP
jgi:maltose O-acetyltransferase